MKAIEIHEKIGEEGLISYNSLRRAVVLINPQSKCAKSFWCIKTCQGRSPEQICGSINHKQHKIIVHAVVDFSVIHNEEARRPAILARGGEGTDVLHILQDLTIRSYLS